MALVDCLFVTPALDGPVTGGTLYNQQLLAAVQARAPTLAVVQCSLEELGAAPQARQLWVDSLYLDAVPALRARVAAGTRIGLLLHYLPSLLTRPALRSAGELRPSELAALTCADLIVTPGNYLQRLLTEICPGTPSVCVTPGVAVAAEQLGGSAVRDDSVLLVSNVTPNKGLLPFLCELGEVAGSATFRLAIAGCLELDLGYAQDCLACCQEHAWLREHVAFLGSVAPAAVLERLSRASVFVSTSTMESYGMALAEARALGAPILALPGGNIAEHVAADSGGALLPEPASLAAALCALMADPTELAARQARARAGARARNWNEAADEFRSAVRRLASNGHH